MSKGPENTFIGSVHKHLPPELYRMKNHNEYNGGIPDCWYSGKLGDLWIEYKFIVLPKRNLTNILLNLSPLQNEWLTQRYLEGRKVGVVVGCKEGGAWFSGISYSQPLTTERFRNIAMSRAQLARIIMDLTYAPNQGIVHR